MSVVDPAPRQSPSHPYQHQCRNNTIPCPYPSSCVYWLGVRTLTPTLFIQARLGDAWTASDTVRRYAIRCWAGRIDLRRRLNRPRSKQNFIPAHAVLQTTIKHEGQDTRSKPLSPPKAGVVSTPSVADRISGKGGKTIPGDDLVETVSTPPLSRNGIDSRVSTGKKLRILPDNNIPVAGRHLGAPAPNPEEGP